MQVDEGEHYLMTKTEMENKIATLTGGRAAEELIFHEITTGASNDIEQATKLARSMVSRFGMSSEFGMVAMETVQSQYLGGDASLTCSMETQTKIDKKSQRSFRHSMTKPCSCYRQTSQNCTRSRNICTNMKRSPAKNSCKFSTAR